MTSRLSDFTTFRLGGSCRRLIQCATPAELQQVVQRLNENFILMGGGSNLLVSDDGIDSAVIRYHSSVPHISRDGQELVVTGSTLLDDLAAFAVEQGLDGLICCTGIPGTVGGAIVGNAGAFGEQIGDRLVRVTLMNRQGTMREALPSDLGFAYRKSNLQDTDDMVVSARLRLAPGDHTRLKQHREEILTLRASKHPDWHRIPTAGSFFKNIEPTSKADRRQAAGWFLEQSGAKTMRVGGARTYEKHANIIIAENGCTSRDVHQLSLIMADAVRDKFGFDLQREVRLIGSF